MAVAPLYNMKGEEVGRVDLDDAIFGVEPNGAVMHEAVVAYQRNQRQGTTDTLARGEVRGGGRKPWRQKGTGHARQGSTRAPHWRHGGIVHGPTPRDLHRNLPDKVNKLARRSALSAKVADGSLRVVDSIVAEAIKTAPMARALAALGRGGDETTLLVLRPAKGEHQSIYLSCRNLPNVTVCTSDNLSAYEIIRNRRVLLDQGAVERLVEVLRP